MSDKSKSDSKYTALGCGFFIVLLILIVLAVRGCSNNSHDSSQKATRTSHVQKSGSQNLPGQKINSAKATKHEFYWTSKSNSDVRYFVDDDKKITAIKVVLGSDANNAWWCQNMMQTILHDNKLKFGNDKGSIDDTPLSVKNKYNLYSPKYKKWYWLSWNDVDGKIVSSFSLYPGKSDEAE